MLYTVIYTLAIKILPFLFQVLPFCQNDLKITAGTSSRTRLTLYCALQIDYIIIAGSVNHPIIKELLLTFHSCFNIRITVNNHRSQIQHCRDKCSCIWKIVTRYQSPCVFRHRFHRSAAVFFVLMVDIKRLHCASVRLIIVSNQQICTESSAWF